MELKAKIKKKLKKLTITFKDYELVLDIEDNQIDLIKWDEWFTALLQKEVEKHEKQRPKIEVTKTNLLIPK